MQLTPDEVASVVLARQRRGPWLGLLTALTLVLWMAAAAATARLEWVWTNLRLVPQHALVPMLKVPGSGAGRPPDPDAPPVAAGEVTLVYTLRPGSNDAVRRLTPREEAWEASLHVNFLLSNFSWAVDWLMVLLALHLSALLSTILLLTLSRRATLRQIQASLAAIAGQLAELQPSRGAESPANPPRA